MKKIFLVVIFSIFIYGCASTKSKITKAYIPTEDGQLAIHIEKSLSVFIPPYQYQLLESQIRNGLAHNGLLALNEDKSQHSVTIKIDSFRMRDDSARLTVGIMAGCDNIKSTVVVMDKVTNEELGKSQISIKECAAWGVASQVITKYTDGVIAYLSNK